MNAQIALIKGVFAKKYLFCNSLRKCTDKSIFIFRKNFLVGSSTREKTNFLKKKSAVDKLNVFVLFYFRAKMQFFIHLYIKIRNLISYVNY